MSELLRYRDLEQYGVRNWVTLGRWIKDQGVPAGFYLGPILGWFKKDWDNLACHPAPGGSAHRPTKQNPAPLRQQREPGGSKVTSPL